MRTKAPRDNALPPTQRARLRALADAAQGCDWGSRELVALEDYYSSLAVPWWLGGYAWPLRARDIGGTADAGKFVENMQQLSRCIDYGASQPCGDCDGCRRRKLLSEEHDGYYSFEEQEAYERRHGSVECVMAPKFEGDA